MQEDADLGRVDLKKSAVDPQVDQLTISVVAAAAPNAGTIKIVWEKTQFSVDFTNAP